MHLKDMNPPYTALAASLSSSLGVRVTLSPVRCWAGLLRPGWHALFGKQASSVYHMLCNVIMALARCWGWLSLTLMHALPLLH